jgi:hypothetical protein
MTLVALSNANYIPTANNEETRNCDDNVNIYVKFAYTTVTANYNIPSSMLVCDMIYLLNDKILEDFGIEVNLYEIVEAGQMMPAGIASEEAPAFILSPNTIAERFNGKTHISFYIRVHPIEVVIDSMEPPTCMVCQESEPMLTNYFGCSHSICDACCSGCLEAGINRCAICRQTRIIQE